MEVKQIASIVNTALSEIVGLEAIVTEDLGNIVEVGKALEDFPGGVDAYVHALPNVIGRMIFVDRVYTGRAPSLLVDSWEYGSVLSKVRGGLYDAQENESWELTDGASYDQGIFTKPKASVRLFNQLVTFEQDISILDKQVRQSFHSAGEQSAFIAMIWNDVEKSMTVKLDGLIMRTVNNLIAETLYNELSSDYTKSGVRAINLLTLYNAQFSESLTAAEAITDPAFLRFASYQIGLVKERMRNMSTLYNIEGEPRFTPEDKSRTILLADFAKGAEIYLYNGVGQLSREYLGLGSYDTVSYWQGSGTAPDFESVSSLDVITADGHSVKISGVIGITMDIDACLVCNTDRRTTVAPYNAKGEFWNYYVKWDCQYMNALDENAVVFFVYDE